MYSFTFVCLFFGRVCFRMRGLWLVLLSDKQSETGSAKFGHINTNLILLNNFYLIAQIILHRKTHKNVT